MEQWERDTPSNASLEAALIKSHPSYAAAASISGMVQELVKGVVDLYSTLTEQAKSRRAFGSKYADEFVDFIVDEALELVGLAYSISLTRLAASTETKKLLLSNFLDDTIDYYYCIDTLLRCVVFK